MTLLLAMQITAVAAARKAEVPGVSARPITDGNPDYLAWIEEETSAACIARTHQGGSQ